jgi:hypothetical protein
VGGQRLALLLALVSAEAADPRPSTHTRRLVHVAVQQCVDDDALMLDTGFALALLQEEGATRYVVRVATNSTFRRARPPSYRGRGRPPTRGNLVRPLPRRYKGRMIPATPADHGVSWHDAGILVRADVWTDLALPAAAADSPTFTVIAVHDPRQHTPLLLASPLPTTAPVLHDLHRDRWTVEHLPLTAKQSLAPNASSSRPPRPVSGFPNSRCWLERSSPRGRRPPQPSPPTSGTGIPSPRPAASDAP